MKQQQSNAEIANLVDTNEELDEDEKAMAQEVDEESGNDQATVLLKQPGIITGGDMRLVPQSNLFSRGSMKV